MKIRLFRNVFDELFCSLLIFVSFVELSVFGSHRRNFFLKLDILGFWSKNSHLRRFVVIFADNNSNAEDVTFLVMNSIQNGVERPFPDF